MLRKSSASDCASDLRQCSCQLHSRGSAADHDEAQRLMFASNRSLPLRQFEGQQHATTNLQRIFDGLQAGSKRLPFVVSKIGVARSRATTR